MSKLKLVFLWAFRIVKYAWLTVWTLYQIALGAVLVGIVWAVFQAAAYFHILEIRELRNHPPRTTAFIESERISLKQKLALAERNGSKVLPDTAIHWNWVPLDSIPKTLIDLTLVEEDSKFYTHEGFDFEQIEYSLVANHQAGRAARGASTITQQVAKNLYLSGDKEMQRKLREAALALLLENTLEKDRILEIYLNIAQFGPGIFGVREAAHLHFGKPLKDLTQDEMLSLVCLLPAPEHWNPKRPSPSFLSHKQQVLRNYALFKGIRSMQDSLAQDWMHGVYDSLGNLLSEQRWKKLRKGPLGDSTPQDSATEGGVETESRGMR